jgi:phosphoribosyl 1,2-cyclic phosphate phosphodiesterase
MRVTVLGCGGSTGVPAIGGPDGTGDWGECDPGEPRNRRTRASIVVESGAGSRLLVDTSPDMRTQLLTCRVPAIDAVLFTHAHADHITGLDDVRVLNRIVDRPLDAFGTAKALDEIIRRFEYAFRPWQPPGFYRPVLTERRVEPDATIRAAGLTIRLFNQDHGFTESLGLRIGGFGYSTDVVELDEAAFVTLAGVDTWLVDCFQRAPHRTHAHFERVLAWAIRVGARRTVLTHMGSDLDWAWMKANLPPGMEPAYDGLALEVPD